MGTKRKADWSFDEEDGLQQPDEPKCKVFQGVFAYNGHKDAYKVNGYKQESPESLKTSFFPSVDTPEAQHRRRSELGKDYIMAQFEHYGIAYEHHLNIDQLVSLMKTSLKDGKFDSIPPSIQAIHTSLREEYDRRCAAYKVALRDWEGQLAKRRATKFSCASTLSEKARIDPELFIKEFFLDSTGNPDPTKQPDLLTLGGMSTGYRLGLYVKEVTGLHVASHYRTQQCQFKVGEGNVTVFLGWDEAQVKAAEAESRAESQRAKAKEKALRERKRYEEHLQYLAAAKAGNMTLGAAESEPPSVFGRYLVRCPTIEDNWEDDTEDGLYLTIRPLTLFATTSEIDEPSRSSVIEAVLDFGVIKGAMMLCADRATLIDFWKKRLGMQVLPDEAVTEGSGSGKDGENASLWKAADGETPLLYHFIWAGIEGGTGEMCAEFEDQYYGKIMFEDGFAKFGGEMDIAIESGLTFLGGGKVSDSIECDDCELEHIWDVSSMFDTSSDDYFDDFMGGHLDDGYFDDDDLMGYDMDDDVLDNWMFNGTML